MNLAELQKDAHAIAVAKGWYDTDPTFGDSMALVHSELSEALKTYLDISPGHHEWAKAVGLPPMGVGSKLADLVIRVADMAEHYGVENLDAFIGQYDDWDVSSMGTFGEWVIVGHLLVSKAVEAFFDGGDDRAMKMSFGRLGSLIVLIQRMAAHYDIDLDAAVAAKMDYLRGKT